MNLGMPDLLQRAPMQIYSTSLVGDFVYTMQALMTRYWGSRRGTFLLMTPMGIPDVYFVGFIINILFLM